MRARRRDDAGHLDAGPLQADDARCAVPSPIPSAGGTSGIFLVGLLKRLGIADAIRAKTILCINGDEVVEKVLSGEAEIGSTFISEIVPVQGVKVVGPLPAAIENATAYAAGIMATSSNREAAGRFIAMLTAPAQGDAWMSLGFEPAGRT